MKYKPINLVFIFIFITNTRCSETKRRAPKVQLSVQSSDHDVGYIQPLNTGANENVNISNILNLLLNPAKTARMKLTASEGELSEHNFEPITTKEETTTTEMYIETTTKIKIVTRGADSSGVSDGNLDHPFMRNGEGLGEDLQYDLEGEDLAISIKK